MGYLVIAWYEAAPRALSILRPLSNSRGMAGSVNVRPKTKLRGPMTMAFGQVNENGPPCGRPAGRKLKSLPAYQETSGPSS